MLISGVVCNLLATMVNNNTYDSLISVVSSTDITEKINNYKQAIKIYPYDTRAYTAILDAYENEGVFSKNENDEFLALYNANKDGFDNSSVAVAELNYKTGMMYFNYYTDESGSKSFSGSVQKAYPFFEANYNNKLIADEFSKKTLSNCYYQICSFYKKYILNSAKVEEASMETYTELFKTINSALSDVKNESAYDQLTLYNGVFMLLYDQRLSMASVNVSHTEVNRLLDEVYDSAEKLSVQKEQSKKLQQEMVDNYKLYKEAINRTYANTEKRG